MIADMPTSLLVDHAVEIDIDGESTAGDNIVLLQMEIVDRIKSSLKEYKIFH